MLDLLTIATAEDHRHERCQRAVREAWTRRDGPPELLAAVDRRRLLAVMGATPALAAVEVADPLGIWPLCMKRSHPRPWPGWGTVRDWGLWTGLCLLALAAGLVR